MLAEWAARGHTTLVVDLTGTRFCDSAGLTALVRAYQQALFDDGDLRVVLPASGSVPRVFTLAGLDQLIPHSPVWSRRWPRGGSGHGGPRPFPGMSSHAGHTSPGSERTEERYGG